MDKKNMSTTPSATTSVVFTTIDTREWRTSSADASSLRSGPDTTGAWPTTRRQSSNKYFLTELEIKGKLSWLPKWRIGRATYYTNKCMAVWLCTKTAAHAKVPQNSYPAHQARHGEWRHGRDANGGNVHRRTGWERAAADSAHLAFDATQTSGGNADLCSVSESSRTVACPAFSIRSHLELCGTTKKQWTSALVCLLCVQRALRLVTWQMGSVSHDVMWHVRRQHCQCQVYSGAV